jgi:hypothetical protein
MPEPILKVKINPNPQKISHYLTSNEIDKWNKLGYVQMELAMSTKEFEQYREGLVNAIRQFGLNDHLDELLFIIFTEDEILQNRLIDDETEYNGINNTIDVSKFLLAFKNGKSNPLFQIGIKENIGTIYKPKTVSNFIHSEEISKWMCQIILDTIESGNYPDFLFGDIFRDATIGQRISTEKESIPIASLEYGATLKNKSFKVYRKRRYAEFCLKILSYLNSYTELKTNSNIKITDKQAKFLFEILQSLNYLDKDTISSPPKDYINVMIRNYQNN